MNTLFRYKTLLFKSTVLILALILGGSAVYAQSYLETFGQNRIQYRKFRWKYFDTKHFRVYHYDAAGRHLGRYVAEESEKDIAVIEHRLGGQFPKDLISFSTTITTNTNRIT